MSDARFQFDEEIVAGDDHPVEIIFYDKDPVTGALTPEDLTDRNWFYTAKRNVSDVDADALIALGPLDITLDSDGDSVNNPTDVHNRMTFWLPRASTSLISFGNYYQDLQSVEIVSGRVFTKGLGALKVDADVTKRTS